MNYLDSDGQKNINGIISIVKLGSLFFCLVIISNKLLQKRITVEEINVSKYIFPVTLITIVILIFGYIWWKYVYLGISELKHKKIVHIVETAVFVALFSVVTLVLDSYSSNFKFIFIFGIISSTIQLGQRSGMITASFSSIVVLIIDLAYAPKSNVNIYFENDLILAASFIFIAWSLGQYVKIQSDGLNEKNIKLQILENKLTEQEKKRKYIEDILLKNDECYNLLIRDSQDAIVIHSNGRIIFSNESATRLMGIDDSGELQERFIGDFTASGDRDNAKQKYSEIYNNKLTELSFEEKKTRMDGETIIVKNTSTYFIYKGKPTILTILHDITSEKQVEKLQLDVEKNIEMLNETREFNKFITEFFSNISHELKTPLNILFSSIQLLGLGADKGKVDFLKIKDKYLGVMKQNCYRLMRLINNLLEMTRVDSGFVKLQRKNCDIIRVIEDITLSIVPYAEVKNINIIFDTDIEEKVVAVDPDKIERIILNILSNALKFTDAEGEVCVSISGEGDSMKISISDTGIGIPEDKLKFIFERFGQVDKSLKRNHEGTGIGLSLVKSFVNMHDGEIEVRSSLGKGSEFMIILPVIVLEEEETEVKKLDENIIERINIEFSDIYSEVII